MFTVVRRLATALVVVAMLAGPLAAFAAPARGPSFIIDAVGTPDAAVDRTEADYAEDVPPSTDEPSPTAEASATVPADAAAPQPEPESASTDQPPVEAFTGDPTLPPAAPGPDGETEVTATGETDAGFAPQTLFDNQPPATGPDAFTLVAGQTLTVAAPGLLANDSDPDGDPLTASALTPTAHGSIQVFADGGFTYQPEPGFVGTDSFQYSCEDGQGVGRFSVTTKVTITVEPEPENSPPVASDDSYAVAQDTVLTVEAANGLLANDTDADGDALSAFVSSDPLPNGTLAPNGDGSFVYTPRIGFTGTEQFVYQANDGSFSGFSNTTTATITVEAANTPPVANDDTYTVAKDGVLTVSATDGVLANDTDADGDALEASIDFPAHGTIQSGVDGSFTYAPFIHFTGTDTFTYFALEAGTVVLGNVATVTITVTGEPNVVPVAIDDAYIVEQNATLTVDTAAGLLANDSDANGDAIRATAFSQPAHGTLSSAEDDGSFTYTPDAGFIGTDSFAYEATDDAGFSDRSTVSITVGDADTNTPPVGVPDSYSVDKDAKLLVDAANGVLANDTDADGDPLIVSSSTLTDHGILVQATTDGSFRYEPDPGFVGTDSFVYRANDGTASSVDTPVTITVRDPAANKAPVAVADAFSTAQDSALTVAAPGVLANDSDPDGDAMEVFTLFNLPRHGFVESSGDGSFVYTPDAGFSGDDTFVYQVTDNQAQNAFSDPATVTITVTATGVNTPPVAIDDDLETNQGIGVSFTPLANDTDADGDALDLDAFPVLPAHGSFFSPFGNSLVYLPEDGFTGIDAFTYTATDGAASSNEATITITVVPETRPVAANDAYTTDQDAALTVPAATGLLANDSDAEGDPLNVLADTTAIAHGAIAVDENGGFTYTPDTGFVGSDSFTYRADDGEAFGLSDVATVTITVTAAGNAPPGANPDAYAVAQDAMLTVDAAAGLLANDTDADGDLLTVEDAINPEHGTLAFEPDGAFTYTPETGFTGTDTFTYEIIDQNGGGDTADVTISVTAETPTPEPSPDPSPVPSPEPSPSPSPEPSPSPKPSPSPEPSPEPSPSPSPQPNPEPTTEPSPEPTDEPTVEPTTVPTEEPTAEPTAEPTEGPDDDPTPEPTAESTPIPTEGPTQVPPATEEPQPTSPPATATAEPPEIPAEPSSPQIDSTGRPDDGNTATPDAATNGQPDAENVSNIAPASIPSPTAGYGANSLPNTGTGAANKPSSEHAPSWLPLALLVAAVSGVFIAIQRRPVRTSK